MFVLLWCDKCTLTTCLSANHDDDRREKDTESSSSVDADEHVQNASSIEPLLIADEGVSGAEFESTMMQASQEKISVITGVNDGLGSKHGADVKTPVSRFLQKHFIRVSVALVLVDFRRDISSSGGNGGHSVFQAPRHWTRSPPQ
jgi:hypothetical protein